MSRTNSQRACNREQDEVIYFTFFPVTIFSFFLASDFLLVSEIDDYHTGVIAAISVAKVMTHEFCMNVLSLAVYEVYRSNVIVSYDLCKRPRVLELNSLIAVLSIFALSAIGIFGAFVQNDNRAVDKAHLAAVVLPFWLFSKLFLAYSFAFLVLHRS